MRGFIEYCKDPHTVLAVQRFFGVYSLNEVRESKDPKLKPYQDTLLKKSPKVEKNGSAKICEEDSASESDQEPKDWVVTNKFWYYLFVFGTELGDEIFYASFIPFWFWNIDGAVGRRVVMVWTIIMYIGESSYFLHF
jgi:sphingosine-1-phosphate phosphatase 1